MRSRRGPLVDPQAEEKKLVQAMLDRAKVKFSTTFIEEPLLEFAKGGTSPDCRIGLREFGAWQTGQSSGSSVTMGVIGTGSGIDSLLKYLEYTRSPVNPGVNRRQIA